MTTLPLPPAPPGMTYVVIGGIPHLVTTATATALTAALTPALTTTTSQTTQGGVTSTGTATGTASATGALGDPTGTAGIDDSNIGVGPNMGITDPAPPPTPNTTPPSETDIGMTDTSADDGGDAGDGGDGGE